MEKTKSIQSLSSTISMRCKIKLLSKIEDHMNENEISLTEFAIRSFEFYLKNNTNQLEDKTTTINIIDTPTEDKDTIKPEVSTNVENNQTDENKETTNGELGEFLEEMQDEIKIPEIPLNINEPKPDATTGLDFDEYINEAENSNKNKDKTSEFLGGLDF